MIEDSGFKVFFFRMVVFVGYNRFDVCGIYMLFNLFQEFMLVKEYGWKQIILDEGCLNENLVDCFLWMICDYFWEGLM